MQEKAILPKFQQHLQHNAWTTMVVSELDLGAYESMNRANSLIMYFEAAIKWIDMRRVFFKKAFVNELFSRKRINDYYNEFSQARTKLKEAYLYINDIKQVMIEHNKKSNEFNNQVLFYSMGDNQDEEENQEENNQQNPQQNPAESIENTSDFTAESSERSYLVPLEQVNANQIQPVNQHDNINGDEDEEMDDDMYIREELEELFNTVDSLEDVITNQVYRERTLEAIEILNQLVNRINGESEDVNQSNDDDNHEANDDAVNN